MAKLTVIKAGCDTVLTKLTVFIDKTVSVKTNTCPFITESGTVLSVLSLMLVKPLIRHFCQKTKENGLLAHVRSLSFSGFVIKECAKLTVLLLQECAVLSIILKLLNFCRIVKNVTPKRSLLHNYWQNRVDSEGIAVLKSITVWMELTRFSRILMKSAKSAHFRVLKKSYRKTAESSLFGHWLSFRILRVLHQKWRFRVFSINYW